MPHIITGSARSLQVFLRNSVFEPLEECLKRLMFTRVVLIQRVWRGFRQRRAYKRTLASIVRIQAVVRSFAHRLKYLRKRRAAITIQAFTRGFVTVKFYVRKLSYLKLF